MKIENVEVFAVGTWNNTTFGGADLDAIVQSYNELNLAGKLPVKLGHDMRDTMPAQGWITALRRSGDKLLATFDQVPQELVDEIKQGRWRHVSVELLGNVAKGDKKYRWVLDGVAVLGAARPAVDSLKGLHELVASALPGWRFGERVSFSRNLEGDGMSETAAEMKQQLVDEIWNSNITSGRIIPATRERFYRRFGRDASKFTVQDVREWVATEPQPTQTNFNRMSTRTSGDTVDTDEDAGKQLVQLTRAHIAEHAKTFGHIHGYQPPTYYDAARQVMTDPKNRELMQRYWAVE